jgi:photosynthetic reaction center cytochrome c subunit
VKNEKPVDPGLAGSVAVYDEKQRRILSGEVFGIAAGTLGVLSLIIMVWMLTKQDLFSVKPNPPRAQFAYNYEGVQRVDYSTYLASIKRKQAQPSAEAVAAYTKWVQENPNTKNVKVLSKYLGAEYDKTANVFGYMSAYFVPGVGVSCEYCHNLADFSSDEKNEKVIARNMLVMTMETQNRWIGALPKPAGQPAHVLVCATCHAGQPKGWNQELKLKDPTAMGVGGAGYPYDYNIVDSQLLSTRVDGLGNVNYFQVQAKAATNRDDIGLNGVARNQNAMYHVNSALQVGCDFCHYGGYFPSYVLADGTFKWPKAQARHMMGMVQDLATNYWPQMGRELTAQPNCYMCHRGNVVPPGASLNAPKPAVVADPLIKPLVNLVIPNSVVPKDTK